MGQPNLDFSPDNEKSMVILNAIYLYGTMSIGLIQRMLWEGGPYKTEIIPPDWISHLSYDQGVDPW